MWLKWIFDRVMALIGLVVLLPVFLVVGILIKIKMPNGPILFRQKRVGKGGRIFTMVKFRSMVVSHSGSSVSVAGELPELWNVLIGDMSFVGPRPDVPGFADKLVGEEREILQLRPGITGPASLKYRNEEELLASVDDPIRYNTEVIYPDKVRINLDYLRHWSFARDLKYIVQTLLP